MNRTSLAFSALFGLTVAGAAAHAEPVMHGAMDICQAIDNGETQVEGNMEVCCATETTEYDDGMVIYGQQYCVACVVGTDSCYLAEVGRSTPQQTIRNVKKALATMPQKAPVKAN